MSRLETPYTLVMNSHRTALAFALCALAAAFTLFACGSDPASTTGVPDGWGDGGTADDATSAGDVQQSADAARDAQCPAPGALDPSFGDGGIAFPSLPGTVNNAQAVAIEKDTGRILVGGATAVVWGTNFSCAVAAVGADGAFDSAFGNNGIATVTLPGYDCSFDDIAIQNDGKIVGVGGINGGTGSSEIGVIRLNRDGTLDTTFATQGIARYRLEDRKSVV